MSWDGEYSKTLQLKIGLHFDTYDLLPQSAKLFSLPLAPSSHPVSTMASKGSFKNSNLIMTFPCLVLHNGSMSPTKSRQQCPVCLPGLLGHSFWRLPSRCGQCFSPVKASAHIFPSPSPHLVARKATPTHPPRVSTRILFSMNHVS